MARLGLDGGASLARGAAPVTAWDVTLPTAPMGLIDEYEFVVLPRIAGHGPRLLDGLRQAVDLKLVDRREFQSGAVVVRYEARPDAG